MEGVLALIDANFDGVVSYREFLFFLTLLGSALAKRNALAMQLGTSLPPLAGPAGMGMPSLPRPPGVRVPLL